MWGPTPNNSAGGITQVIASLVFAVIALGGFILMLMFRPGNIMLALVLPTLAGFGASYLITKLFIDKENATEADQRAQYRADREAEKQKAIEEMLMNASNVPKTRRSNDPFDKNGKSQ